MFSKARSCRAKDRRTRNTFYDNSLYESDSSGGPLWQTVATGPWVEDHALLLKTIGVLW